MQSWADVLADNFRVVEADMWPTSGYVPGVKFTGVRVAGG
jgi:hypothetical protein